MINLLNNTEELNIYVYLKRFVLRNVHKFKLTNNYKQELKTIFHIS